MVKSRSIADQYFVNCCQNPQFEWASLCIIDTQHSRNDYFSFVTINSMNTRLKRIEATLHDLGNRQNIGMELSMASNTNQSLETEAVSFRISPANTDNPRKNPSINTDNNIQNHDTHQQSINEVGGENQGVAAFSVETSTVKAPNLPKFKTPSFSSHHNVANPALAMNMLQEIQQIVGGWQVELKTIIRQIQDIYIEGPIVNGWLESHPSEVEIEKPPTPSTGTATLRHGDVDELMNYVEEICAKPKEPIQKPKSAATAEYKLCGLDASGKMWTRPCPSEQVAGISMAIARYQKLRQLLGRKQYLELRLNQLAETLVMLHGHIQEQ